MLKSRGDVQNSNTADMIFGVKQTIAFLSRGTTLLPGDIIFTGTPSGVGSRFYISIYSFTGPRTKKIVTLLTTFCPAVGRNPKLWLRDGDVVEVALEGVGSCTNKVEFARPASKL
jgi:2-keto-4-pentenoate hydratase/2-oxohepta-3-ene-1,7-dioic acid hydratase in catechol pathway